MNKLRCKARKNQTEIEKGIEDIEKIQVEIENELKMQKGKYFFITV